MNLLDTTTTLMRLIDGFADDHIVRELDALATKLKEQRFYIVVVGFFKRGKSTLINALLEKDLAPVAVTPLTAIVSVMDYAETPLVNIHFLNGEILQTNIVNIEEYVTEDKNPENARQVSYVHILDNASMLKNVSLVDTPGLGSAYEHNTEVTLAFVPRIDAALFILSADIPVSKMDIELLKTLHQSVPKIIFVFNKADLLSEADLEKMVIHNKNIIAKELRLKKDDIEMLIVSGREKDIWPLKNKLLSFSKEEKNALLQASAVHQINLLRAKALLQIQLKRDALLMPLNELEAKQSQLNSSIRLMNEHKGDFESIISGKINLLQQAIHESVNAAAKKIRVEVYARIDELTAQDVSEIQNQQSLQAINDFILARFETVKNDWEQKAKEHFKNLLIQYIQRSQSFLNELAKNLRALLDFNFEMIAEQFDLNVYSSFYLTLDSGKAAAYHSSVLLKIILPNMARRRIKAQWQQHYNEIIVRNAAAIIYDLQYKIQESFRKFNYDLNNRLQELLNSIHTVLQNTRKEKSGTEQAVAETARLLENKMKALQELQYGI